MTKAIISAIALSTLAAPAAVTLSFDTESDLEGFTIAGDVTALAWSAVSGGTMRMEDTGGWGGNGAQFSVNSNPAMWAELQLAVIHGGTISYDFTVINADQTYSSPPNWFETVIVGNSGATPGWDQNTMKSGIDAASWPVDDTFSVSLPIQPTAGGSVGNDGEFFVDLAGGWANIHMGMNSGEGADITQSVVYFDNITISAVPEPSTLLLGALSLAALLRRRRA